MYKKVLSFMLTFMIACTCCSCSASESVGIQENTNKFLAPISAPDPDAIVVTTAEELANISKNLTGSYVLGNDIDLSGYNGGIWIPIGETNGPLGIIDVDPESLPADSEFKKAFEGGDLVYANKAFGGTLDGQGHRIINLNIPESEGRMDAGLFGFVSSCTIKNVGVEIKEGGSISSVDSNDSAGSSGGIFARGYTLNTAVIENCYTAGAIFSQGNAGGLVGISLGGVDIKESYSSSNVSGGLAGGLISWGMRVTIKDSNSSGNIYASGSAGGLASEAGHECYLVIENSFSTGRIDSENIGSLYPTAGGLVGQAIGGLAFEPHCYYTDERLHPVGGDMPSAYGLEDVSLKIPTIENESNDASNIDYKPIYLAFIKTQLRSYYENISELELNNSGLSPQIASPYIRFENAFRAAYMIDLDNDDTPELLTIFSGDNDYGKMLSLCFKVIGNEVKIFDGAQFYFDDHKTMDDEGRVANATDYSDIARGPDGKIYSIKMYDCVYYNNDGTSYRTKEAYLNDKGNITKLSQHETESMEFETLLESELWSNFDIKGSVNIDKFLAEIDKFYPRPSVIKVVLNGNQLSFDQPPIIVDGRTLVPVRTIFEAMGASVDWDGNTQTITAKRGNDVIVMQVGNTAMTKNGKSIALDVAPQIINGRTLVPVRAVADSFNAQTIWNGDTYTVEINY